MKLAQRMEGVEIESAFDVLVKARAIEAQGHSVIHLEIGEPDFPTPTHIIEAGKRALDEGWTRYGPTAGQPELREAIARQISSSRKIGVSAKNVCVVPGAKPILFFAMLALVEPGDEVIYPDPGFPIYRSITRFLGATPVPIPLREERGFSFDLDLLRDSITEKTRLLILNSPQNPTGGVIPKADLIEIADLVRDRDLLVLSDEIYSKIFYTQEAPASIASLPGMAEKTILLDGFSKSYSMTGWRIGYGAMPEWIAEAVNKLTVNSNSCTASFTQRAALAALEGPQEPVDRMVQEFRRRRDRFCDLLSQVPGFRCPVPAGAFYAFVNTKATGLSSKELADYLLKTGHVACLSGASFGDFGEGYIRFSYANSMENLEEAVRRIQDVSGMWSGVG